ncbi:MAG: hypothetical protein WC484_04920, partial [Candidatus Omnitrophota bacterium]
MNDEYSLRKGPLNANVENPNPPPARIIDRMSTGSLGGKFLFLDVRSQEFRKIADLKLSLLFLKLIL